MKHIKSHPIADKSQNLSRLKREDHRSSKDKRMSAEKDLAVNPKVGKSKPNPSNQKLDGEKFLSESVSLLTDSEKELLVNCIEYCEKMDDEEQNDNNYKKYIDVEIKKSIYSKLGISKNMDKWEIGSGY